MYSVSPELYQEVAARLADAVDGENYFSGSLAFRFGDTDAALAARRRCGACFGPRARMVGVSHLLGGGRNAERFRFFRDEALCLIPAVGMSCRRCGQPPDPRFASGRSPAAGRAPSGSPPRSFRHLPFLGAAQPAGTLFFSPNLPPRRRAWVQNFYKWS